MITIITFPVNEQLNFDNTTKKHFTFRKGYVSLASGASSGTETI